MFPANRAELRETDAKDFNKVYMCSQVARENAEGINRASNEAGGGATKRPCIIASLYMRELGPLNAQ